MITAYNWCKSMLCQVGSMGCAPTSPPLSQNASTTSLMSSTTRTPNPSVPCPCPTHKGRAQHPWHRLYVVVQIQIIFIIVKKKERRTGCPLVTAQTREETHAQDSTSPMEGYSVEEWGKGNGWQLYIQGMVYCNTTFWFQPRLGLFRGGNPWDTH